MSEQNSVERKTVRKRRVFYIPGYDPFHPRRYRELYRKESAAQADISGYEIGLKPKEGKGLYGWHVSAAIDDTEIESEIQVLYWADMVKTSMDMGILPTYGVMLRTAWTYIGSGALWRLMRLRKGPVIAALYPVGFLVLQAVLAWLAAYGLAQLMQVFVPNMLGVVLGWGFGSMFAYGISISFAARITSFSLITSCMTTPIPHARKVRTRQSLRRVWASLWTALVRRYALMWMRFWSSVIPRARISVCRCSPIFCGQGVYLRIVQR